MQVKALPCILRDFAANKDKMHRELSAQLSFCFLHMWHGTWNSQAGSSHRQGLRGSGCVCIFAGQQSQVREFRCHRPKFSSTRIKNKNRLHLVHHNLPRRPIPLAHLKQPCKNATKKRLLSFCDLTEPQWHLAAYRKRYVEGIKLKGHPPLTVPMWLRAVRTCKPWARRPAGNSGKAA